MLCILSVQDSVSTSDILSVRMEQKQTRNVLTVVYFQQVNYNTVKDLSHSLCMIVVVVVNALCSELSGR